MAQWFVSCHWSSINVSALMNALTVTSPIYKTVQRDRLKVTLETESAMLVGGERRICAFHSSTNFIK